MASRMFQAMWRIVALIPCGCVASYGQVADLAGYPRHARHVARALRSAPRSLGLPWHRVLNARGGIAFPAHSEPFEEQCRRLAGEGVVAVGGRVNLARHRWRPSLDEILWGAAPWDPTDPAQDASLATSSAIPGALPR